MAAKKYELGSAYMQILPSMEGIAAAISKELGKAVKDVPVDEDISKKVKKGFKDGASGSSGIASGIFKNAAAIVSPLNSALKATVLSSGKLFGTSLVSGAKTAGLALSTAVAAVGTQTLAGGFTRALGINQATAGLKAMGYEGAQFKKIMDAAGASVDGTAYSMDQSVLAARNFLAAGVPEEKLQGYLQNVGKLADMGIRSYDEISIMLQSMAATGVVQGGDMLQLAQAGIPIFTALAETMGKSVAEIKKLGSEGKISFADLNRSIEGIQWDSAIYAATDVKSAFGNVRAQLSKIGANLWTPIIEKLPGILNDTRAFLSTFSKVFDFNPIQVKLSATMDKIGSIFSQFKNKQGELDPKLMKSYINEMIGGFGDLSTKLDAYKPIIIGALVGISGSFLSSIPIIGPAFAGLTPIVGAFSGVLYGAYQNSEELRNAIKGLGSLWNNLSGRLFDTSGFKAEDFFGGIGDKLAVGIKWVQEFLTQFIDQIGENLPRISMAIDDMFTAIGKAFSSDFSKGFNGEALANIFTSIIEVFTDYVPLALTAILNVSSAVATILSSSAILTLVDWLGSIFSYIAANEGLIMTGLLAAGGIFAGKKLIPVMLGILDFGSFLKAKEPIAKQASKAAPSIASSFKGLLLSMGKIFLVTAAMVAGVVAIGWLMDSTGFVGYVEMFISMISQVLTVISDNREALTTAAVIAASVFVGGKLIQAFDGLFGFAKYFTGKASLMSSFVKAAGTAAGSLTGLLLPIAKIALVVTAVIAAVTAIGWLMENTGFMDHVNTFIDQVFISVNHIAEGLANVTETVLPTLSSILEVFTNTIGDLVGSLLLAIVTPVALYLDTVSGLIDSIGGATSKIVDSFSGFLDAGSGLVANVAALLVTMSNGEQAKAGAFAAAEGIAALFAAIIGGSLQLAGSDQNPLAQLQGITESVLQLSSLSTVMPGAFAQSLALAVAFGLQMPTVIANGLEASAPLLATALGFAISSALQQQQTYLDANPLKVRLEVDSAGLGALQAATSSSQSSASSGNTYNRSSTYNLTTSSDTIINKLLNDGRGR